jgi:hypothetical protein
VFVPFVLVGETSRRNHGGQKEFCAGEIAARGAVAGARRTGMPLLRRVRRLPVSAHRLRGAVAVEAQADCGFVRARRENFADKIAPVIPCPQPYGYRNRIMIRSQWNKPEQKLNIGFIRADNGLVEDIEECKIAEPALNEQIRTSAPIRRRRAASRSCCACSRKTGTCRRIRFSRTIFSCCRSWSETVRGFLRDSGARHLIDLYCGVGFFGIELADAVESFVGVEYDQRAINRRGKTRRRGKFPTANSWRPRWRMFCRSC